MTQMMVVVEGLAEGVEAHDTYKIMPCWQWLPTLQKK